MVAVLDDKTFCFVIQFSDLQGLVANHLLGTFGATGYMVFEPVWSEIGLRYILTILVWKWIWIQETKRSENGYEFWRPKKGYHIMTYFCLK